MCLWNPATQETKILPEFKRFRDEGVAFSRSHYVGFCFDAETSDFKVILVFCPTRDRKRDFVYSLRGDCWKTVEPRSPRCFCYDRDYGIAMNSSTGMCHWFGSYLVGKRYKEAILSFEANREIFKTTIIPYSREDEYLEGDPDHGFFMLEEYVAMFHEEGKRGAESYEIWAMLEVGVEKSWIKVITFGPTLPFEKVLRFWKGKIFLQTYQVSDKDGTSEDGVVIFDPFTRQISPFLMHRDMPCFQLAANYKKSQFQLIEKVVRRDTKKLIIKRPRTN